MAFGDIGKMIIMNLKQNCTIRNDSLYNKFKPNHQLLSSVDILNGKHNNPSIAGTSLQLCVGRIAGGAERERNDETS
jgi:hypothetical protein